MTPRRPIPPNALLAGALAMCVGMPAAAFTTTISSSTTKALYLRIGDGTMTGGNYNSGGVPGNNSTINVVSVTVPAVALGNATAQAMTGSGSTTSSWDGYAFCNAGQVYIGGFYRYTNSGGTAVLSAQSSAPMTDGAGNSIPFTQISWTSSGNGDTGAEPIPAGTFNGGTQTLANFPVNNWQESCHSFSYANSAVVAAGTFSGRVTYTLVSP